MRFQSIDAGLPPEHATEQGLNSTQTVVSARDAQKLLRMPGAKSIRQGATLIVVDAQGTQYIVKEFEANVSASDPEAALDEEDELSDHELPESTSEDGQVIVVSASDVSATVAEVQLAQAPAEGAPSEKPSEEQNCKDKDDKKASDGGVDEEEDDDACLLLWGSHWGLGLGLGVMGVGLVASAGGGGGSTGGGTAPPPPSAPELPAVALGFVINGQAAGDYSGYSVSAAGDVNGDGLADLIVGAADGDPAMGDEAGRSYVVFGKAGGVAVELSDIANGVGGFVINGQAGEDYSGYSVSAAGDVNGDGLADLIVGAPDSDPATGDQAGRSYVVFGKADGTAVELSDIDAGSGGFVINGEAEDDYNGFSVSAAGDVNGDGLADLIVGAHKSDPATGDQAGRSYVVFGKAGGTAVDLSDIASGLGGFVINGEADDDHSGYSVSAAGDVNGDGLADVVVGAHESDTAAGANAGRSYVVFGKADGTAVELSDIASGSGGFVINGQAEYDYSGISVSSAGDVNGDGLADLIVGASEGDPATGDQAGRSYVVFGKAGGTAVELSDIDAGLGGFVINGQAEYDHSGISVSSAGDVNGDGLADLIVGASDGDPATGDQAGRSYVVFGKAGGMAVELSDIASGSGGFVIDGQAGEDGSGISVSAAGDVNADGLADLIVGASDADPASGSEAGRSYVVFGKADGTPVNLGDVAVGGDAALAIDFTGDSDPNSWAGTAASEIALGGQGDDTLVGNGGADVLYGGAGRDTLVLNADNIARLSLGLTDGRLSRVDGGGGIDTLAIDGDSVTLDLSVIANQAAGDLHTGSRIASIEKIDLTGSGNNTLILTVGDVLDMAGMNLFNTGNGWSNITGSALGASVQRHQLVVDGDAGDVVSSLEAAGSNTGELAGRSYVVFGKADGTAVELSDIDAGSGGFVINGQAFEYDHSGISVSSAGDVNGDGLADLIVGASEGDPATGDQAGRSYVVFGKTDGTAVELSNIDAGVGGFVINGQASLDRSGYSVSSP
ncbi:beta strand repeat-containing protein [Hydrogenophaga sp.]|uniref:beta strand repeat-containing protein n=1 Tax=Hydrogenophaga sp. TaxID=1904254 RepID=UPI003D2868B2